MTEELLERIATALEGIKGELMASRELAQKAYDDPKFIAQGFAVKNPGDQVLIAPPGAGIRRQ